jgi:hypothetical protein
MMIRLLLSITLLCAGALAHADFLGAPSGRSANPANLPKLSVEGSLSLGSDYRNLGARVNYNVNDALTVYGDFGLADVIGDGAAFGGGVFYYLPTLSESIGFLNTMDTAIQGSFHTASLDDGGFDIDYTSFGAALLVSPKEPLPNGMTWYANAGFFNLDVDFGFRGFGFRASDSSFELQVGGGISLPLGPGTLYAGVDRLDVFTAGVGYRFGLQ